MAKIPKGAKVEFEAEAAGGVRIPKGAKVEYDGPTPEEAAAMPGEKSKTDRFMEWLKSAGDNLQDPGLGTAVGGGVTLGVTPYLSAAVDAGAQGLRKLTGNGGDDISDVFNKSLDRNRAMFAAAEAKHPIGKVVGEVISPNLAGKATLPARLLSAGLAGGISNATRDGDALGGAGLAAGAQGVGEVVAPGLGRLGQMFRGSAGEMAVKAAGSRAGITDKLAKMGYEPDEFAALGNRFMDEGLIPTGLNPFRKPLAQTASRAQDLQSRAGGDIGRRLDRAEAVQRFDFPRAADETNVVARTSAQEDAGGRMRDLVDQVRRQEAITPGVRIDDMADPAQNSFRGANRLKSDAYKAVDWKNESKLAPQIHRQGTSNLRGAIERQVGEALGPDEAAAFRADNGSWGTAADAEALAQNAISRGEQKQPFGLTRAAVAGVAGGGLGQLAAGVEGAGLGVAIGSAANDLLLTRGPNFAARGLRAASGMSGFGSQVVNQSPSTSAALSNLIRKVGSPEAQKNAAQHITETTGKEPKDKDDVAREYFLGGI